MSVIILIHDRPEDLLIQFKTETGDKITASVDSPVLAPEDELPQLEVPEHQSVVVAMRHGRGYLIEESGSFVLPQLLAGADERVHVPIAPLEEHIRSSVPEQDFQDLVDVLVLAQGEVGRQGLLVAADVKHLQRADTVTNPRCSHGASQGQTQKIVNSALRRDACGRSGDDKLVFTLMTDGGRRHRGRGIALVLTLGYCTAASGLQCLLFP